MSGALANKPGWYSDMLIDTHTRQIIQLSGAPRGTGTAAQIDLVRFVDGHVPNVGDILNPDDVLVAVEVKTTASASSVDSVQKARYSAIFGSSKWDIAVPSRYWNPSVGWGVHPKAGKLARLAQHFGKASGVVQTSAGAITAVTLAASLFLQPEAAQADLDEAAMAFSAALRTRQRGDFVQLAADLSDVIVPLKRYLSAYSPADAATLGIDLGLIGSFYYIYGHSH